MQTEPKSLSLTESTPEESQTTEFGETRYNKNAPNLRSRSSIPGPERVLC